MSACSLATMACGTFGGATSANQVTTTKPGTVSFTVGTPGSDASGFSVASPSARIVPARISAPAAPMLSKATSTLPATRILHRRRRAAIVDVLELHARHLLEQLRGQMRGGADALGRRIEHARIGLGVATTSATVLTSFSRGELVRIAFGTLPITASGMNWVGSNGSLG